MDGRGEEGKIDLDSLGIHNEDLRGALVRRDTLIFIEGVGAQGLKYGKACNYIRDGHK